MDNHSNAGLAPYHGCRVAVISRDSRCPVAIQGVASYEQHELLGNVLRIHCEPEDPCGALNVLISEAQWDGEIQAGDRDDCDFRFFLDGVD